MAQRRSNQSLMAGDIILTSKGSLFAILMNFFQKDPCVWGHVLIVKDEDFALESGWTQKRTSLDSFFKKHKVYKIIRPLFISKEKVQLCIECMESIIGRPYSINRIFLQALDHLFNTNWFTRLNKNYLEQVCSSYVAWGLFKASGYRVNNVHWAAADPDDFEDDQLKNPGSWDTIIETYEIPKQKLKKLKYFEGVKTREGRV